MVQLRKLSQEEIQELERRGCRAQRWEEVKVHPEFRPQWISRTRFLGRARIGDLRGSIRGVDGIEKPCCIENAVLKDCRIGDHCRINNVGEIIENYDIGEGVLIENVGTISARESSTFGNGVVVSALNEAGGREVILCHNLSSQLAYLLCLYRFRDSLVEALAEICKKAASQRRSEKGLIGRGSHITSVRQMRDVWVEPYTVIEGASLLCNGTVLSEENARTYIGSDVIAKDFIFAEGSSVKDGAVLEKVLVGQACKVGKQFSAENSLFFANSELFHGEAVSVFAGPYTVSHHKSTLLIAGLFSFYNAGSGTNQSNHRYKLGPVHEGKLLRGCKTGSFAYLMWPCAVGPFSVIMGKNTASFDTAQFPFSHIEARPDGRTSIVPGLNLLSVGLLRDGAKWPARDRRTATVKRDALSFDVLSPYTVGLMIKGREKLKDLRKNTDRSLEEVSVNGVVIPRPLLRTGERYYSLGIEVYLLERIFLRLESYQKEGRSLKEAIAVDPNSKGMGTWHDIGGLLLSSERLEELIERIEKGKISEVDDFNKAVEDIRLSYKQDEWAWVKSTAESELSISWEGLSKEQIAHLAERYASSKAKYLRLVLTDAEKEFDSASRIGFAVERSPEERDSDFSAVRGNFEANSFVKGLKEELNSLEERVERFKKLVLEAF